MQISEGCRYAEFSKALRLEKTNLKELGRRPSEDLGKVKFTLRKLGALFYLVTAPCVLVFGI